MGEVATAPAVEVAGHLARIEAMLATGNAEVVEKLDRVVRDNAALRAELVDLRRQVADGRAREWLSIAACARRFDVSRAEVLRRIAAGDLRVRPKRAPGGADTSEIHIESARTAFGGA